MSASIKGTISVDGYGDIKIDNLFSGYLVITDVSLLPAAIYQFLHTNEFEKVKVTGINLTIDLVEEFKSATLEQAWLTKTEVKPGDRFQLIMKLMPRRGKVITETIDYVIPANLQSGTYRITVGNGAAISQQENEMVQGQIRLTSVAQMIRQMNILRTNYKLYAQTYREEEGIFHQGEFFPGLPHSSLSVMKTNKAEENFVTLSGTVVDERNIETNYVVSGLKKLTFTVKR
jgi:hypothetical protein